MKVFNFKPSYKMSSVKKYLLKGIYILGLILIALTETSCVKNSKPSSNELKEWDLRGSVKSISETDYSNAGKYTTYLQFNANGSILEQASFNPDGTLIRKWKFEYNTKNQKLNRSCYVLKDSLSEILHYSYNESGNITVEKLVNPQGGIISDIRYEYDVSQKKIAKRFLDKNAKIQGGVLYKYDAKNNITEETHFDSVYHQNWKQKNSYNQDGFIVEILYLSLADSLLKRITNIYLSNNKVGETCFFNDQDELVSKTTFKYDKQLNITSKLIYSPPDKKTEKHTFEYRYDKNHNWTSRNEFVNDEPVDMITRKIEYFD
jgi:hypothetical protein